MEGGGRRERWREREAGGKGREVEKRRRGGGKGGKEMEGLGGREDRMRGKKGRREGNRKQDVNCCGQV